MEKSIMQRLICPISKCILQYFIADRWSWADGHYNLSQQEAVKMTIWAGIKLYEGEVIEDNFETLATCPFKVSITRRT